MKFLKKNRWLAGLVVIITLIAIFVILDNKGLIKQNNKSEINSVLSLDNLKNANYKIGDDKFKLVNGTFRNSDNLNDPNNFLAELDTEHIAYNNNMAAVIITMHEGGSGQFRNLLIMNVKDNQPKQISTTEGDLDDRSIIQSISFSGNKISVKGFFHGSNDPMCCPTLEKTLVYNLTSDNKLEEQNCSDSITPDKAIENVNNLQEVKDWYVLDNGNDKSKTFLDENDKSPDYYRIDVSTYHLGAGTFTPFSSYKVDKCSGKILCDDKDEKCF